MSDEQRREPGEEESTNTADVRDAIQRAREATEQQHDAPVDTPQAVPVDPAGTEGAAPTGYTAEEHVSINTERMPIQEREEMPSAASEVAAPQPTTPFANTETFATQETVASPNVQGAPAFPQQAAQPITIEPDHPMAPLYFQQPNPPNLKANRLAGILISLLGTLVFAVIYAGLLALWRAQYFPPSRFIDEGILPYVSSLGFILPVIAFFVGMVILVLIFNRAGWWVYVIFGFLVAALVWGTAGAGYSLSPQLADAGDLAVEYGLSLEHIASFALTIPGIMAGLTAREVAVWFGAWIGARGRRIKRRNAEAMQEYETKLQELQVPQTA